MYAIQDDHGYMLRTLYASGSTWWSLGAAPFKPYDTKADAETDATKIREAGHKAEIHVVEVIL